MFNTQLLIINIGGSLIDTIEVGSFKTLRNAYKNGLKKGSEVEKNYSIWSNQEVRVNGKECYENMEDKIILSN